MADRGFTLGRSISVIAPGAACVLTLVEEIEEQGERKGFCGQSEEGDAQLWKSAGLQGGVSAVEQMSQSLLLGKVEAVGWVEIELLCISSLCCHVGR